MTASALASPTTTLIAALSPPATTAKPRESAAPGAFARELEQAEAQTRPEPQASPSAPTPPMAPPTPAKPMPAGRSATAAQAPASGASASDKAPARTEPGPEQAADAQVDDDPLTPGGKPIRPGIDPARLRLLRAAAADAASPGGKLAPAAGGGDGLAVDAVEKPGDLASDPDAQAGLPAVVPSCPAPIPLSMPVSPAAEPGVLPGAASSWAAMARPAAGPGMDSTAAPAVADGDHDGRAAGEALSLGNGVPVPPGSMMLRHAGERAGRTAQTVDEDGPKPLGPERAGVLAASEHAEARLQAASTAPLAQPVAAAAGESAASPLVPSFAAELLRASPSAAAPQGASPARAATELNLSTPVNNPEFVPRLSGELAVLARDGVQEARVQVNPLELGPIAVQITLEGKQAQVHLAVDNAQTRELLEQSMPSLAAALRENGLTLTGGGVFQQARQNPREADAANARGDFDTRGEADAGIEPTTVTSRTRHLGVLDTYA